MTRLSELERALGEARRLGSGDPDLRGIAYDSRRVRPGDLFVCVRGFHRHGREFLPEAVGRGAVAALLDDPTADALPVPALLVPSAREAMARAAAAFYDHPSRRLQLVGVTGTNGKTTTTTLIEQLARAAGKRTGVVGTLGWRIGDETLAAERTTPEAPDLQEVLKRMVDRRIEVVAMETSSHALALQRTLGCEFDVGVFTNLTQDHLDFHPGLEEYFEAKALLFTEYPRRSEKAYSAVINSDDPAGRRLAAICSGRVLTYGTGQAADLRASEIRGTACRIEFTIQSRDESETWRPSLPLGGLFNVHNALAAMGAARSLGIPWEAIAESLEGIRGVPGRFEFVDEGQPFSVIVDYAHSPDGLENLLRSARALRPSRLLVVFGCGGDRDRTKRPVMGEIAARMADRVFVTSDNPRSESPEAILEEILAGIDAGLRDRVWAEVDRTNAIRQAMAEAREGDLVAIAGKGHETTQIFADRAIHFDDREVAREALRGMTGV